MVLTGHVFIRVDSSVLFFAYATDRTLCKRRFLHFCIAPVLG